MIKIILPLSPDEFLGNEGNEGNENNDNEISKIIDDIILSLEKLFVEFDKISDEQSSTFLNVKQKKLLQQLTVFLIRCAGLIIYSSIRLPFDSDLEKSLQEIIDLITDSDLDI